MKKLAIVSGKGGTGKTSLIGSFAALAGGSAVLVDGDVDAANLSLITGAKIVESNDFYVSKVAAIDQESCNACNLCLELCRFDAIKTGYSIDLIACEGCALCCYACPQGAIKMDDKLSGQWFVSETAYGTLVHARLGIAEENSGKLVTVIRNKGEELALAGGKDYLLIDGPPGIGCPVIASLSGMDRALVVTEPTVSGVHDLKRIIEVCLHFKVPVGVCINRCDLDEDKTSDIDSYCQEENIPVIGKIPYNQSFVHAMLSKMPLVKYDHGLISSLIEEVWDNFRS